MKIAIQKTQEHEIEILNQLIVESRTVWNYDDDYFQKSLPLIRIDKEWLSVNNGFTAFLDNEAVAFLGLESRNQELWIEHLWVKKSELRKGIGKQIINFLKCHLRKNQISQISIFPDPPAEKFYLKVGAKYTGEKFPSRVSNGPTFSKMTLLISN